MPGPASQILGRDEVEPARDNIEGKHGQATSKVAGERTQAALRPTTASGEERYQCWRLGSAYVDYSMTDNIAIVGLAGVPGFEHTQRPSGRPSLVDGCRRGR